MMIEASKETVNCPFLPLTFFSLLIKTGLIYPKLASASLCSSGSPRTYDPPLSTSQAAFSI